MDSTSDMLYESFKNKNPELIEMLTDRFRYEFEKADLDKLRDINNIIDYMESTNEESWCEDVVKKGDKNCFYGHLFDYAGGEKRTVDGETNYGTIIWDWFESQYATTFMVYPVNDGDNEDYQQSTPKKRVIAYLKDLRDGEKKTTHELMDECYEKWKEKNNNV